MAGIPKRRVGERRQAYRLRVLHAEYTRRDEKLIAKLEYEFDVMLHRHTRESDKMMAELNRAYRAKPGTKYDRTAKRKRK